jgi:hypothetical protein
MTLPPTVEVNFKDPEESRPSDLDIEVDDGGDAPVVAIEALEPSGPEASDSSAVPAVIAAETSSESSTPVPGRYVRERKERLKTVALTEEAMTLGAGITVTQGDTLTIIKTVAASGLLIPACLLVITYQLAGI